MRWLQRSKVELTSFFVGVSMLHLDLKRASVHLHFRFDVVLIITVIECDAFDVIAQEFYDFGLFHLISFVLAMATTAAYTAKIEWTLAQKLDLSY